MAQLLEIRLFDVSTLWHSANVKVRQKERERERKRLTIVTSSIDLFRGSHG
ncbi:MAG: hypothetical protein MJE68_11180 [Proteobacteria bacterium]|nr:hypothetical protein [Pseudomonadota bacterium]